MNFHHLKKEFIFLAGLHRSGTSLLHEIIQSHPLISGLSNTGRSEGEGQHVQSVYKAAHHFGGPGNFAHESEAYMNEFHSLATQKNAELIFKEWSTYLDLGCNHIIEKSPPNLIRTRFLQELFPTGKFIIILRHPIAIAYATKKWSDKSISQLIQHALVAYEIFYNDLPKLNRAHILKYEEFVLSPQKKVDEIFDFLGLDTISITQDVKNNVNEKYFNKWKSDQTRWINKVPSEPVISLEKSFNLYGYSATHPLDVSST